MNCHKDKDIYISYGKLIDMNNKEIFLKCNMKEGSSGSPILLTKKQKLIDIHSDNCKHYKYNKGVSLIYSIIEFSKIKNNILLINKQGENISNCIINSELYIKEDGENIRIINSYEQSKKEVNIFEYEKENENEKEIKENCEIKINGELIPFSFFS